MTDYFSHFCFAVPFNTEQTSWATRLLAAVNDLYTSVLDEVEPDPQFSDISEIALMVAGGDPKDPVAADFEIKTQNGQVLITDYAGQGSLDAVPRLIFAVMQHFDLAGKIGFEWGETANRSVPGAFGGGAFIVSKNEIQSMSAHSWLSDRLEHPRLTAINAILASWDFGAEGRVTRANLSDTRLADPIEDGFSRDISLKTENGDVEAKFEVKFARGTSIALVARIHADGFDYGRSPLVQSPVTASADDTPQP